jgi:hypothetical protein
MVPSNYLQVGKTKENTESNNLKITYFLRGTIEHYNVVLIVFGSLINSINYLL